MSNSNISNGFASPSEDGARAFRSIMTAMARPGKILDLETNLGLESYNTILQWIISGAPCGDDSAFCQ